MSEQLIDQIRNIAGDQRRDSFALLAQKILDRRDEIHLIVETGCYRGNSGDGESTTIFANLVSEITADMTSIDINSDHVDTATHRLSPELLKRVTFFVDDSVHYLSYMQRPIDVLYLDSYDYNAGDPLPCQMHQLAEFAAAYGKLNKHCLVLLDDNVEGTGGKTTLAAPFIESKGFKRIYNGYQILFER